MNDSQSLLTKKRRNRVIFSCLGIGLLMIGILLGLGIAGETSVLERNTRQTRHLETSSPSRPLLTKMPLVNNQDIQSKNSALIEVAKLTRPAVVNISTSVTAQGQGSMRSPFLDDPFFRRFFGEEFERKFEAPESPRQQGTGSVVIVREDGYIITNNHVVEAGDEIQVTLSDKRNFKAEVVGTDPKTDLALLKIDADNLPAMSWGDSRDLQVGEIVMAVGSPFGLNQTVTMGIVSAVGRANVGIVDYEDFIQTDAAINPGNSGGALVNLKGELIGINTAIFSRSGGYMGIGFAIPSNMAKSIQTSLIEHGKVVRGWLGVSIQDLTPDLQDQFDTPDTQGALVSEVLEDSPAQKAGLKRGDIIREYDSQSVTDTRHLRSLVAESLPNAPVKLQVLREGDEKNLKVTIAEMPKDMATLASTGKARGEHALAGVTVEPAPSGEKCVKVTKVEPGSSASRSGIQEGDLILEINRQAVKGVDDFQRLAEKLRAKDKILLLLQRGRSTIFLSITP
ncbi:MAG: MucD protein [Nitrospirales bacterium]|nr:MAG: MucD protein [Nitrospirales bacterium]